MDEIHQRLYARFCHGIFELSAEDDLKDAFVLSVDGDPLVLSTILAKNESLNDAYPNPAATSFRLDLEPMSMNGIRQTHLNGGTVKLWRQAQSEYRIKDLPRGIYLINWRGGVQFGSQVLVKN
ncbi:MAG: hypothetical protein MK086_08185 [Flavobacteriales bacterium]|nr:hypothetical protein [Flavobacteriales bacterium]